jgi:hypothetical protein
MASNLRHGLLDALVRLFSGLRGILCLLAALALLAAPLAAGAQPPPKIPRIGYLGAYTPSVGAPKALGIKFPQTILIRAEQVIE